MPTIRLRVRPGASRTSVGGDHGGALVVRVAARAVDGGATEATLRAVAQAFGVRRRDVTLVHGRTSRDKVVQIDAEPAAVLARERLLRAGPDAGSRAPGD